MWAARAGNQEMAGLLVELGADVHYQGRDMRTALFWAEQNNFEELADSLRKHGIVERKPYPPHDIPADDYYFDWKFY
eukprot:CAMPEP_0184312694 /NCGR_PEP_ID=MMETSP1049-20130417/52079_1 /TAXON_ID=77928 /ORGANISM="Proteomonas sulcata, Strain CCMP704" /LENGTH=76 /DNA_ID=CAMNT_0026629065 /DNA_START=35 /DNA_END=265 /DNA_ORIENTATION=-